MKLFSFLSFVRLKFYKIDTAIDKCDANFITQTNDLENAFNTEQSAPIIASNSSVTNIPNT